MGSNDSKMAEFVSLSKCLPTFLDRYDGDPDHPGEPERSALGRSIMQRMQMLINNMDKPVGWEEKIRNEVVETNAKRSFPTSLDFPPPYTIVDGERVLTEDDQMEAERQLVAERLRRVVLHKLDNLGPDDSPGLMIEVLGNDAIQAYVIPYTAATTEAPKLRIFRFSVGLLPHS